MVDFRVTHATVLARPSFRKVMLELVNTFSMKSPIRLVESYVPFLKRVRGRIPLSRWLGLGALAFLWFCTSPSQAANLLVNPGFEANSGHAIPNGWTYFSPPEPPTYFGDYWIEAA